MDAANAFSENMLPSPVAQSTPEPAALRRCPPTYKLRERCGNHLSYGNPHQRGCLAILRDGAKTHAEHCLLKHKVQHAKDRERDRDEFPLRDTG